MKYKKNWKFVMNNIFYIQCVLKYLSFLLKFLNLYILLNLKN